ncbi:MAG TPA: prephenate dehydrogenase [Candidatus Atribacteria bacterium]|nr:prephenate dehydrogenase [Candidatus Atribacteria bacterium]
MTPVRITIIGLGLIGGSLAKALRRTNPDLYMTGIDLNKDNLSAAFAEGVVDHTSECFDEAAAASDVVFLCTPMGQVTETLKAIGPAIRPDTVITDTCSIKTPIMQAAAEYLPEKASFVGGHPMAGAEMSGYASARAHLFENAYYILTPGQNADEAAMDMLSRLISSTGALPLVMDPETHDRLVGGVSHLPHCAAAALVNAVIDMEDKESLIPGLAAGGFRDITRIASSNPQMWQEITLANRDHLIPLLSGLIHNLQHFRSMLDQGDTQAVRDYFQRAKSYRDSLPLRENLYQTRFFELYVDVEDKPGAIGQVATILGTNGINIKNIRVINSRENEPGCLLLSIPDGPSLAQARGLLISHGLKAYAK